MYSCGALRAAQIELVATHDKHVVEALRRSCARRLVGTFAHAEHTVSGCVPMRILRRAERRVIRAVREACVRHLVRHIQLDHRHVHVRVGMRRVERPRDVDPVRTLRCVEVCTVNHDAVPTCERALRGRNHLVPLPQLVLVAADPAERVCNCRGKRRLAATDYANEHEHV